MYSDGERVSDVGRCGSHFLHHMTTKTICLLLSGNGSHFPEFKWRQIICLPFLQSRVCGQFQNYALNSLVPYQTRHSFLYFTGKSCSETNSCCNYLSFCIICHRVVDILIEVWNWMHGMIWLIYT